jgi:hypothetical protein
MSDAPVYDLDAFERGSGWQTWGAWIFFVGAILGVLWVAWALSVPGTYFGATLLIPIAAFVFSIAWLAVAIGAFATDRQFPPRKVIPWLLTPVLAIAAYPFVVSDAPMRVRLELSRSALDPVARDVTAGRRAPPPDGRLAFYEIRDAQRTGDGFAFLVEGAGFIDPCGLVYSPRGEPSPATATSVWHIAGPWYGWCDDF